MVFGASAQNIDFYFELIPEAQLPHLKPDLRKGMVGLYQLGQPARVPNMLGGTCMLDTLSTDFLSMHTTNVSTLSIKMFENKADTTSILAVVHTVQAAGTFDSTISFFTNTWSLLPTARFIELPTVKDFYLSNDKVSLDEFSRFCIPLLICYKLDDDKIIASIDPEKYLPEEVFKQIAPAIKPQPITYKWNGSRYVCE